MIHDRRKKRARGNPEERMGQMVELLREDPRPDAAADFGTLEAALVQMQQGQLVGCLFHCPEHGYEIARPQLSHLAHGATLEALVAALRQMEISSSLCRKGACA